MENGKKSEVIIIAPHPDDEIIGCYSILTNKDISPVVIYTENVSNERREEALKLKDFVPNLKVQLFQKSIPGHLLSPYNTYYFPDPIHEFHPAHRMSGSIGENFLREMKYNTPFNGEVRYKISDYLLIGGLEVYSDKPYFYVNILIPFR